MKSASLMLLQIMQCLLFYNVLLEYHVTFKDKYLKYHIMIFLLSNMGHYKSLARSVLILSRFLWEWLFKSF